MSIKALIGVSLAGAFSLAGAQAAPVTIDFTAPFQSLNISNNFFSDYTEDGFVVASPQSTSFTGINNLERLTVEAFTKGFPPQLREPDTITFVRDNGGVFTFQSFDYITFGDTPFDEFQVLGFVNDVQVQDYGIFSTSLSAVTTVSIVANAVEIDELRLVATGNVEQIGPVWDNFVFDVAEVPLPAALPLFLAGLAGLGFAKRRRKA